MNLRYANSRFEAELSPDLNGDMYALSQAGFKRDQGIWHTIKVPVLEKLRQNRPASGITIDPDALEIFKLWQEAAVKNAEVKAAARKLEKERKKAREQEAKEETTHEVFGDKEFITAADLSPQPPQVKPYIPPPLPEARCFVCDSPLYFYELPDICIWCSKSA